MGIVYLLIIILAIPAGIGVYTQHCKNQNARDIHRALSNGERIPFNRTPASSTTQTVIHSTSFAGELEKLSKLHDSGALTDEEFEAAKKRAIEAGYVSAPSNTVPPRMDNENFDSSKFVEIKGNRNWLN